MTATRATAHAATVSRLLGQALDHGRYRRSHVAGFTVTQHAPDVVEIEWHGNTDDLDGAFRAITARLDGPYDVTPTQVRRGSYAAFPVTVLHITPGTPLAAADGTDVPDGHTYAPSYAYSAPWDSHTRHTTAAQAADAVQRTRDGHGAATLDPATGVITLHVGKTREDRHTLTPSTPAQLAAHRAELQRTAEWRAEQARTTAAEAARLRAALDDCPADDRHSLTTRLYTADKRATGEHQAATEAAAALATLDPKEPAMNTTPEPARRHMNIGPRSALRVTRSRGGNGLPSDVHTEWTRTINGRRITFIHTAWRHGNGVTLAAYTFDGSERHRITLPRQTEHDQHGRPTTPDGGHDEYRRSMTRRP
ncbi:hypothetical protein ACH4S8_37970 [Streptomyces sp. NPDC021080]|uniref:hypothetical protein n=1 Tax=Streptomyces sp. NPDC021080 TaxID=3365110 RepID=UPI0037883659